MKLVAKERRIGLWESIVLSLRTLRYENIWVWTRVVTDWKYIEDEEPIETGWRDTGFRGVLDPYPARFNV